MERAALSALLVVPLVALSACGSLVNGTRQDIAITSNMGQATVTVDGVSHGQSPVVVPVSRKHAHVVRVEREGYEPVEFSMQSVQNEWVWGNILFGGLIGLGIDAIAGGMYDVVPDRVQAYFQPMEVRRSQPPVAMRPVVLQTVQ